MQKQEQGGSRDYELHASLLLHEVPPSFWQQSEIHATAEMRFSLSEERAQGFGESLAVQWLVELSTNLLRLGGISFRDYLTKPGLLMRAVEKPLTFADGKVLPLKEKFQHLGLGNFFEQFMFQVCLFGLQMAEVESRLSNPSDEDMSHQERPSVVFHHRIAERRPQALHPLSLTTLSRIATAMTSDFEIAPYLGIPSQHPDKKVGGLARVVSGPVGQGIQTPLYEQIAQAPWSEAYAFFKDAVQYLLRGLHQDEITWQGHVSAVSLSSGESSAQRTEVGADVRALLLECISVMMSASPEYLHHWLEDIVAVSLRRSVVMANPETEDIIALLNSPEVPSELIEQALQATAGNVSAERGVLPGVEQIDPIEERLVAVTLLWSLMGVETRKRVLQAFSKFFRVGELQ